MTTTTTRQPTARELIGPWRWEAIYREPSNMRKLALNDRAILVKAGREYWTIALANGWQVSSLNSQETDYNATNALASFTQSFGEPTWVHEAIQRF